MLVVKIKGAVMQDAAALSEIIKYAGLQREACIAVVAAPEGMTRRLAGLWQRCLRDGKGAGEELRALEEEFGELARRLLPEAERGAFRAEATRHFGEVCEVLAHAGVLREEAERVRNYMVAQGNLVASLLFRRAAGAAWWRDARNFIVTEERFGAPEILWDESCRAAEAAFRRLEGVAVVPAACGKTRAGHTVSLGAVGLELTAAVLEAAFRARKVA